MMRLAVLAGLLGALSGCLGPISLHHAVLGYDRTVSQIEQEMLLLNIARLRHRLPVHFTVTSSIAATFDYRTNVGFAGVYTVNPYFFSPSFSVGTTVAENSHHEHRAHPGAGVHGACADAHERGEVRVPRLPRLLQDRGADAGGFLHGDRACHRERPAARGGDQERDGEGLPLAAGARRQRLRAQPADMALFGAPMAHQDHAARACYADLRMQDAVRRYSDELRRAQGVEVQIRVGLNSGEVVVRAIGSDLRMDYTGAHLHARRSSRSVSW